MCSLKVVPIIKKYKVHLFLSGHDHNLQHIHNATNVNDVDYVISGAGGRSLYNYSNSAGNSLINQGFSIGYFGYTYGFTDFEFAAHQVTFNHVDLNGNVVYTFTRSVSSNA
jgi:tartrate-resistant acid phosphatase type 5